MSDTIYVNLTGDNSSAVHGNINMPYEDLQTALSAISADNTSIVISNGTYSFPESAVGVEWQEVTSASYARTLNIPFKNITIRAINQEKVILDCMDTQPAVWFLSPYESYTPGGSNPIARTSILIDGIVVKNFKKTEPYDNSSSNSSFRKNGSALFNVSAGIESAPASILMNKCIIQDCIIQNYAIAINWGLLGARKQYAGDVDLSGAPGTHRNTELGPNGSTIPRSQAPNSQDQNAVRLSYKNCLFNNIHTDQTGLGNYSLFAIEMNENSSSTINFPITANLINNTLYFKQQGNAQYGTLFAARKLRVNSSKGTIYNVRNNLMYNVGDSIITSDSGPTVNETGVMDWSSNGTGRFLNNCLFGFDKPTDGAPSNVYPAGLDFSSLSGNLFDTDPQILAPEKNRWGLRQSSPCKNTGSTSTDLF